MDTSTIVNELTSRLETDGKMDFINMIEIADTVQTIGSLVLGILSVAILILVPLISVIEIVYICFPVVRDKMEQLIIKVESKGMSNRVLGFTLRDAREAVERANTNMIGERSALWIYFQLKIKSIFFVLFVLVFVVQGYKPITDFIWKLFGGLVEAFL